ncbi:MAG: imidazolonepropionase [bacterium]|nr:imidazolonepropionase [bacterium]
MSRPLLFTNIASLVRVTEKNERKKTGVQMRELYELKEAFLLVEEDKISDFGPMKSAPSSKECNVVDCAGRLVLPGFVDSHTHVLYAGNRAEEFEMRAAGKTYVEIAEAGGGIKSSLKAVRNASEEQLIEETVPRLNEMLSHGTTTAEIKSGYGLTVDSELKMLRAIQKLKKETPITLHATFLGAHDIPTEYQNRRADYISLIIKEMIPQVVEEKLATFCDVFCDKGYFTPEETLKICQTAQEAGLKIRLHANELAPSGGVQIACAIRACSADHLLFVGDEEIRLLKSHPGIMPIVLPGTSFFLKLPYAPARRMIDENLPLAMATDANPGSCTALSLPFIMSLATTQMNLLPSECLTAVTINAAASLGISDSVGSLEKGKQADFILTQPMPSVREIPYSLAQNRFWRIYKNGKMVREN